MFLHLPVCSQNSLTQSLHSARFTCLFRCPNSFAPLYSFVRSISNLWKWIFWYANIRLFWIIVQYLHDAAPPPLPLPIKGHAPRFYMYLTVKTEDENTLMFLSSIWGNEISSYSKPTWLLLLEGLGRRCLGVFGHENSSSQGGQVFLTTKTPPPKNARVFDHENSSVLR